MNDIKKLILKQVCSYLYDNGITIDYNVLNQNIILDIKQYSSYESKPTKFKFKPNKKSSSESKPKYSSESKPTKFKFKPNKKSSSESKPKSRSESKPKYSSESKPTKFKFKPNKKSSFKIFIDLCTKHNIPYFNFNDINSWNGPAIKCNDTHTPSLFKSLDTTIINGYGFNIIRPTTQCINCFIYPIYNDTLEESSLILNYSDDDDEHSDVLEEVLELDEWFFQDVKYLIDESNNILYSYQTHERVGKKVDEFNIQLF